MSEKKFANGGQIGKSARMKRLKSILSPEVHIESDPLDEFDIEEEVIQEDEPIIEDSKSKRMSRIGEILKEITLNPVKK